MPLASVTFIVLGVLLNINQHKGWGWTMIIFGVLVGLAAAL